MGKLDAVKLGSYKTPPFAALAVLGWAAVASAGNTLVHGLPLPSGSTEVGENRYRSGSNYEDTIKFFTTNLKGLPKKPIANQPGIKAVHFDSIEPASGWEGINVYERAGETRIFVIPREGAAAADEGEEHAEKKKRHKKEQKDQQ
jgi:hypothetical protein